LDALKHEKIHHEEMNYRRLRQERPEEQHYCEILYILGDPKTHPRRFFSEYWGLGSRRFAY
jgi:hypothetical protein